MLEESISTICGIAIANQSQCRPSAFVSFQTVYMCKFHSVRVQLESFIDGFIASLCADNLEKQEMIVELLREVVQLSSLPVNMDLNNLISL